MRAVDISHPGGPDVLRVIETPVPTVGAGEVLIRVAFAGVNRADTGQRAGRYPPPPGSSEFPGLECSGWIVEVGEHVTTLTVGDPVCALLAGGGYAEYVVASAGHVLPIPEGIDMAAAASLPEVACTVYSNLNDIVDSGAVRSVLIHGGASGIGVFATQWLAAHDVVVYCTAGSAEKTARCIELGAQRAFDYHESDFASEISTVTEGRGVDAVLDIIGAPYLYDNLACLSPDGFLVLIATQGGAESQLDLKTLIRKRLTIRGSNLRGRDNEAKAEIIVGVRNDVWPRVADGRIQPVVHRVLPFTAAAEAHRMLEASQHMGKIVLAVSAD